MKISLCEPQSKQVSDPIRSVKFAHSRELHEDDETKSIRSNDKKV